MLMATSDVRLLDDREVDAVLIATPDPPGRTKATVGDVVQDMETLAGLADALHVLEISRCDLRARNAHSAPSIDNTLTVIEHHDRFPTICACFLH